MKSNIFDNLYNKKEEELLKIIKNKLKKQEKTFIITANAEIYMKSFNDSNLFNILNNENNIIIPDGILVVKLAKYLGYNIEKRITGIDLCKKILEISDKNKYKIYLYGANKNVLKKLKSIISNSYRNTIICGSMNGYNNKEEDVLKHIKKLKPDIVLVALGVPKQEKFINKIINQVDKGIYIGVCGTFDVLSGYKKRAPKILIKLNLEWLYRIVKEPKRIKRFFDNNIKFIFKIIKIKKEMRKYND